MKVRMKASIVERSTELKVVVSRGLFKHRTGDDSSPTSFAHSPPSSPSIMALATTAINPWYVVLQEGQSFKTQTQYVKSWHILVAVRC